MNDSMSDAPIKVFVVAAMRSPLMRERALIPHRAGLPTVIFDVHGLRPGQTYPEDVEVIHVSSNVYLNKLLGPFVLWRALKRVNPDLVHVHWAAQDFLNPLLARRHPLVVSTMGSDVMPEDGPRGLRGALVARLLKAADLITTKSAHMTREIAKRFLHGDDSKFEIVPWGVRDDFFAPKPINLREQIGAGPDERIFLSIRAMEPRCRQVEILEQFIAYKKQTGSTAHIAFTAFNVREKYFQTFTALRDQAACKEQIHILEPRNSEEMPSLLAAGDCIIHYAMADGLPQTLFESMAMGQFNIVPDLPHFEGLVRHKDNAFILHKDSDIQDAFAFVEQRPREPVEWNIQYAEQHLRKSVIDEALINRYRSLIQQVNAR
jgi:hypothetical protein